MSYIDTRFVFELTDLREFFDGIQIAGKAIKDIKCIGLPKGSDKEHWFVSLYNSTIANGYSKPWKFAVSMEDLPDDTEFSDVYFGCYYHFAVIHIVFDDNSVLVIDNKYEGPSKLGVGYYEKEPRYRRKEEIDGTLLFEKALNSKVEKISIDELSTENIDRSFTKRGTKHPYDRIQLLLSNGCVLKINYRDASLYEDKNSRLPIEMSFAEYKKCYLNIEEWFSDESVDMKPAADMNLPIDNELIRQLENISMPGPWIAGLLYSVRSPESRQSLIEYIKDNNPDYKTAHRYAHELQRKETRQIMED